MSETRLKFNGFNDFFFGFSNSSYSQSVGDFFTHKPSAFSGDFFRNKRGYTVDGKQPEKAPLTANQQGCKGALPQDPHGKILEAAAVPADRWGCGLRQDPMAEPIP
ncbi:hypothetical protein [Salinisphaera sp. G21_0]|uniref:hypothetical protein n=1 Tax=Salinisphaera sp. G21_0 TaxID=2821094 RepID=UPI001ADAF23A|nr:hypothetical protein [Salinisphaera sp. G21_0]MBO9483599.1 hypothetical protein [Salinisphaera sp. G21_0]